MKCKKGIILAGGTGTRLYPLTIASNKQLLPIYDKPVIYYPLTTLMLAGIREILIISTHQDVPAIKNLLGDGSHLGLKLVYEIQDEPRGLPDAFIMGKRFVGAEPVALILGDNFFHGHGLSEVVYNASQKVNGAHLLAYTVDDPSRYGVVILNEQGKLVDIIEKPKKTKSRLAVTGLYFFDETVSERATLLRPSARGELEITDLIKLYMHENKTEVSLLGRGYVWFDVGTPESLLQAANYVSVIQTRQAISIAVPEEVAWRMGFIDSTQLEKSIIALPNNSYKKYLNTLVA